MEKENAYMIATLWSMFGFILGVSVSIIFTILLKGRECLA